MKKLITAFFLTVITAYLPGAETETLPDKQIFFAGTAGESTLQLELTWRGDQLSGRYTLDNSGELTISDQATSDTEQEIKFTTPDSSWLLKGQQVGDTPLESGYAGQLTHSNITLPVTIEPVAEFAQKNIKLSDKIDVKLYYPVFFVTDNMREKINAIIARDPFFARNNIVNNMNPNINIAVANTVTARANALITRDLRQVDTKYTSYQNYNANGKNWSLQSSNFNSWTLTMTYAIKHYSSSLISITNQYYEYSGGAHGNYGTNGINVALVMGQCVALQPQDLLKNRSLMLRFSDIVLTELKKKVIDGWLPENPNEFISLMTQFSIADNGVTFYFAPNTVNAYAAGEYTVTIPWSQIQDIANTDGPLKEFYQN